MGKLIVFEGIDGSGKSTQFKRLCRRLEVEQTPFMRLAFPQYSEPSSALIRMYLAGEFGTDPQAVNAYAASAFYAVDRYASYVKTWRAYYEHGGLILADRYTTSNAIHQACKLPPEERETFFRWLYDFEHVRMELPVPDNVIYMDIPMETAAARMRIREAETNTQGDIHETDLIYLKKCWACGAAAADYYGWHRIACVVPERERSVEEIHGEIYSLLFDKE